MWAEINFQDNDSWFVTTEIIWAKFLGRETDFFEFESPLNLNKIS